MSVNRNCKDVLCDFCPDCERCACYCVCDCLDEDDEREPHPREPEDT